MGLDLVIDGLNTEKGLAVFNGKVNGYKRVLKVFYEDALKKVKDVEGYLKAGDIKAYAICVHALRGACVNIGAEALSQMAMELEAAGKKNDLTFIEENTKVFLSELESLAIKLKAALEQPETVHLDKDKLFAELNKLAVAVEKLELNDITTAVEAITPFAKAKGVGDNVEKILESILTGDYDGALVAIRLMLA